MKFIPVREAALAVGYKAHHAARNIRLRGIVPKRRILTIGNVTKLFYSITEDELNQLKNIRSGEFEAPVKSVIKNAADVQMAIREREGWTVIPNYRAGAPDLILIRKNEQGNLELVLEEVKGPGDGIRKEQYLFAEKMKLMGVEVKFSWL
jgi:hypothetical protein